VDIEAVACVHNLQYRFSTGSIYGVPRYLFTVHSAAQNCWCRPTLHYTRA